MSLTDRKNKGRGRGQKTDKEREKRHVVSADGRAGSQARVWMETGVSLIVWWVCVMPMWHVYWLGVLGQWSTSGTSHNRVHTFPGPDPPREAHIWVSSWACMGDGWMGLVGILGDAPGASGGRVEVGGGYGWRTFLVCPQGLPRAGWATSSPIMPGLGCSWSEHWRLSFSFHFYVAFLLGDKNHIAKIVMSLYLICHIFIFSQTGISVLFHYSFFWVSFKKKNSLNSFMLL